MDKIKRLPREQASSDQKHGLGPDDDARPDVEGHGQGLAPGMPGTGGDSLSPGMPGTGGDALAPGMPGTGGDSIRRPVGGGELEDDVEGHLARASPVPAETPCGARWAAASWLRGCLARAATPRAGRSAAARPADLAPQRQHPSALLVAHDPRDLTGRRPQPPRHAPSDHPGGAFARLGYPGRVAVAARIVFTSNGETAGCAPRIRAA